MIDPRYLVRLDTLPPVYGAPTAYLCTECGAAWVGSPTCSNYNPDAGSVVECLNLSAPPGDPPERLDALGWALAVLAKRVGFIVYAIRAMDRTGVTTWCARGYGGRCVTILTPEDDGWEDYDHTDANQLRRIAAAVLRKTHVQKVSP